MSILEEIAYVDNVQQFIRGHIDNLAIEHSQGVPKVLFNNGFNFDESNNTDPIHQEKLITENKEDFKNEIENFDNNLRINDMDESKIDESPNLASIEIYKSSKRKKSKGMLSQYKSFTIKKDIMNAFNSENSASLQLGQGCQNSIKNPNKINLKIKTKNGKENNRYPKSNISLRNPDKCDSPLLSNCDKETYQESLTGLNNEKIIQKLDKIRDCVAKENGVVISSKSLVECLSHSMATFKNSNNKMEIKPFCKIETMEVNDNLTSKIKRITSIAYKNEQFSSTKPHNKISKDSRYQSNKVVKEILDTKAEIQEKVHKSRKLLKLASFETTPSSSNVR